MALARYFPVTIWLWHHLTSRASRRVGLSIVLALVTLALSLRVYTAIFVYRVHTILAGMEQLKSEQTTRGEMLRLIPALRLGVLPDDAKYGADERFSVEISNYETFFFATKVLSRLGLHAWRFRAGVDVRKEKVHGFGYSLCLFGDSGYYEPIILRSENLLRMGDIRQGNVMEALRDESPNYQAWSYFKWPELELNVAFSPAASPELIHHAFDVRLGCMLAFGCGKVRQMLPLVWDDKQRIEAAARTAFRVLIPARTASCREGH